MGPALPAVVNLGKKNDDNVHKMAGAIWIYVPRNVLTTYLSHIDSKQRHDLFSEHLCGGEFWGKRPQPVATD
jgi:hypothetical protein